VFLVFLFKTKRKVILIKLSVILHFVKKVPKSHNFLKVVAKIKIKANNKFPFLISVASSYTFCFLCNQTNSKKIKNYGQILRLITNFPF